MSPYKFVANSPILFIDPDGKEIKIHGNIFFKGAAFMDLQKPTNTKLVLLKDGTVKKYSDVSKKDNIFFIGTPNTTKNLKEGTRLVDKLIKGTKTVDIDYDENRSGNSTSTKYAPASEIDKNGKPGMGTGSRIEYDPTVVLQRSWWGSFHVVTI
ncbi:MAG TPA: hypothetical protein VL098_08315 [Flavipsychrobacter sp.]|nr:hypothetical protein [Flavipsychrobacter sp.]